MDLKPATVISKKRGDEPEIHYLIGLQRSTREEAEKDLKLFEEATKKERYKDNP